VSQPKDLCPRQEVSKNGTNCLLRLPDSPYNAREGILSLEISNQTSNSRGTTSRRGDPNRSPYLTSQYHPASLCELAIGSSFLRKSQRVLPDLRRNNASPIPLPEAFVPTPLFPRMPVRRASEPVEMKRDSDGLGGPSYVFSRPKILDGVAGREDFSWIQLQGLESLPYGNGIRV